MLGSAAVVTILGHERGKNAFAQTAVGHAQSLAWPDPEQSLEDRAARKHEIGALLADARLRNTLGMAHGNQAVRYGADIASAKPAASTLERS